MPNCRVSFYPFYYR